MTAPKLDPTAPELLTAAEIAPVFKVNVDTILRWARNGWVPCHRFNVRTVRFCEAEVRASVQNWKKS